MNREERFKARRAARLDLHARRGPILPWDVALTVAILVVSSILMPIITTASSAVTAAAGGGCGSTACTATVGTAVWLGLLVPVLTFFVGGVVSVVRLVRHRRGWKTAVVTAAGIVLSLPLAWGVALIGTHL